MERVLEFLKLRKSKNRWKSLSSGWHGWCVNQLDGSLLCLAADLELGTFRFIWLLYAHCIHLRANWPLLLFCYHLQFLVCAWLMPPHESFPVTSKSLQWKMNKSSLQRDIRMTLTTYPTQNFQGGIWVTRITVMIKGRVLVGGKWRWTNCITL